MIYITADLFALLHRLREIKMSEYDGRLYEEFSSSVRAQVKSLRIILDNLQVSSHTGHYGEQSHRQIWSRFYESAQQR